MSKRPKTHLRPDRRRANAIHLAIDRGPMRRRGPNRHRAQVLILLMFAAMVGGLIFARSRTPAGIQMQTHDSGPLYIPGTGVRFGQDQRAASDDSSDAVDPDSTQIPAPEANGEDSTGGAPAE
jgi:hypothetical protein